MRYESEKRKTKFKSVFSILKIRKTPIQLSKFEFRFLPNKQNEKRYSNPFFRDKEKRKKESM